MTNLSIFPVFIVAVLVLGTVFGVHFFLRKLKRSQALYLICAEVGLRAGLTLSLLYALAVYLCLSLFVFLADYQNPGVVGKLIIGIVQAFFLYLPLATIIAGVTGVVPACLLGYFSGLIIGLVLSRWKDLSLQQAIAISGTITASLALLLNLVASTLRNKVFEGWWGYYWVLVVLPSLIYIGWGGWMGNFVQRRMHTFHRKSTLTFSS